MNDKKRPIEQVDPLVNEWLTFMEGSKGRAASTTEKYRGYLLSLQNFLHLQHDGRQLLQATPDLLEQFTGIWLHRQKVSPRSRHVVVAAVKGFYTWAKDKQHLPGNPAVELVYPKSGRKLPRQLGLSNAERLLMQPDIDEFSGLRDATMIALLMGCGMRVSGLVNLNQGDLFWYEYKGRERLAVRVTEKGGHERELPVPHEAMLLLQAYLGHDDMTDIDRVLPDGNQVLFVSIRNRNVPEHEYSGENRRLTQKSVWKMIQRYGEQAGLPAELCHPHTMRHMLGAEMMEEDANTLQIQAMLGHADPKTSEIYARVARGKLTEVLDRSNPLGKINTIVSPLVQEMKKQGVL